MIISTPPSSLLIASWAVRLFKKKLIIDIRDLWIDALSSLGYVNKDNFIIKWIKRFEINCWKKANLLLVNSITTSERIKQILGKNSISIKYLPFNPDLDIFQNLAYYIFCRAH